MLLHMHFAPVQGLPYQARVDLGADVADHMATEALLPRMRRGMLISAAADATALQMTHGKPELRLIRPHNVVLFGGNPS
jgi:hypothetical protein